METKNSYGLLLLLFLIAFMAGCNDDEPETLRFYDASYEVPVHGTRYIGVESGSGDYTLAVENYAMFSASREDGWSNPSGMLLVRGLLTGESMLTVTDNVTRETRSLQIKVIDSYEVFRVSTFKNKQPVLSKTPFLFLINNQARDVYFADMEGEKSITDNGLRVRGKGTYSFTMEGSKPYLILTYSTDENGLLADDTAIVPTPHKFLITKSSEFALHRLDENLNLSWGTSSGSYPADQRFLGMKMEEVESGYKIEGELGHVEIPRGILK